MEETTPYFQKLKKEYEERLKNVKDARGIVNSASLDENQMYSKIGEALEKSPVRQKINNIPTARNISRSFNSPSPEQTEVLQVIPVDDKRQVEIRVDPSKPGRFEYVAVAEDIDFKKNPYREKDSPFPPEPPKNVRKDIASLKVDSKGQVEMVKAGFQGSKEKAVERLMLEATKRDMTPHSSNLLEHGKKMVSKFKSVYEETPKEKYLAKLKNFLETGKSGKIWSTVVPILGPVAKVAALAGGLGYSDFSGAATDAIIPGGMGELGQDDSEVLRDRKYRSVNLIPNSGMLGDYTDAPDVGRYQQKVKLISNRGM